MHDFRAPRWLPGGHAQTIWPVLFSRRYDGDAAARSGASAGPTPDGDFVDVDWLGERPRPHRCSSSSTASRARRASHYARSLRRRGARGAAGASRCRTFAAARASSTWRRAPTTRATARRSAGCWRAFARCTRADRRRRRLARRQRAAALRRGGRRAARRARARGRRGLGAARPRRRRDRDRPRLRPAGLHPHVPALDEAQGARAKLGQHPGLFDAAALRRRATCATSTTSSPRRCTASRDADDYYARGSAKPQLGAIRIPALVLNARNDPFLPGSALPRRARSAAASTLWQPAHGGHVGFASGAGPGISAPCPRRSWGGSTGIARRLRAADNPAMDAIVAAALKKWPNVPHCYGWLALDARGDWYMRDDRIQARRAVSRRCKGSRIEHEKLREFIARNYAARRAGRLVLPERAAARLCRARGGAVRSGACCRDLDARAAVDHQPHRHAARFRSAQVDEHGRRLPRHRRSAYGIVHTLDMEAAGRRGRARPLGARGRSRSPTCRRASAIACSAARSAASRRRTATRKAGARPADS